VYGTRTAAASANGSFDPTTPPSPLNFLDIDLFIHESKFYRKSPFWIQTQRNFLPSPPSTEEKFSYVYEGNYYLL